MAVVGSRVETMREGNTNLAVKTDVIVDPKSGLVLERKTIVAEMQTKDGRTAVVAGQKTTIASVQPLLSASQQRAIQAAPVQRTAPQCIVTTHPQAAPPPAPRLTTKDKCALHCIFCFLTIMFPPAICCWILYCCTCHDD